MAGTKSKKPIGLLTNFQVISPRQQFQQGEALDWLARVHARAEAVVRGNGDLELATAQKIRKLISRFGCDETRIGTRGVENGDTGRTDFERMDVYRIAAPTGDSGPYLEGAIGSGMLKRTQVFAHAVLGVMERMYPLGPVPSEGPAHIIHVTCTGYSSPSAAQAIVDLRGWQGHTDVTHAYHMGCYASLPAVRMAEGFVAVNQQAVDIVHTEMCSLHLNPLDYSPEQLVVNSLFADGFIKYTVAPADEAGRAGLEVQAVHEFLIPGTRDCMTWVAADWGMKMSLSRDVPHHVSGNIEGFLDALLSRAGFDTVEERAALRRSAIFAIHPGGPRIIDATQKLLELSEEQIAHSKEILFKHGNMSSATLPHIWNAVLSDPEIAAGRHLISLAFGPGLTIFGAVLRKRSP